mgnify:FL=1
MTRLTEEMIIDLPENARERSKKLKEQIGMDLKTLAFKSIGENPDDYDFSDYSVASVPITAGLGVIGGFSLSVKAILEEMGFECFVTTEPDVDGFYEALEKGADIIFVADDKRFLAYNAKTGIYSENVSSTAAGYSEALDIASGGLKGKDVLVIGAGRVGSESVRLLVSKGAKVKVTDIDFGKAKDVAAEYGAAALSNVSRAISEHKYILDASPGLIPGELIVEGAVISSMGIPYSFDAEGEKKSDMIIHDPLNIGTAVMAAKCVASPRK